MLKEELIVISGGAFKLTQSLLNSFSRAFNTVLDFGRTVGTTIRMLVSGKRC